MTDTQLVPQRLQDIKPDRELPPLPKRWTSLATAFLDSVRKHPEKIALVDSTGEKVTYKETFRRAVAASRVLSRNLGPSQYVGVLLPPMNGTAVVNIALVLLGKVPVNLNYTGTSDSVNSPIRQCGITDVITSQKVLSKTGIEPQANILLADGLRKEVTGFDKGMTFAITALMPNALLGSFLPGLNSGLDDLATIIFTTGSEGDPKGVELTHSNILHNLHQVDNHASMQEDDVVLGILPFFHSLGFTVTLWTVLALGKTVVFHLSPLEPKVIGKLMEDHKVTIMACTPTLMRSFLARCTKEQFANIRWLLLGSEKLKPELDRDIRAGLDKEPVEGYGCTELSPVVAANVPGMVKTPDGREVYGNKPGTVGQPVPGTMVAIIDPATWNVPGVEPKVLPRGQEGLILVKGPQVMRGYHKRPDLTEKVLRDGWYCTGDIGVYDADGFITITDRLSQFAKVAGEMVPLIKVAAAIKDITGGNELSLAVTAIPDLKRGERVIVVYVDLNGRTVQEVVDKLGDYQVPLPEGVEDNGEDRRLPKLWLPGTRDFVQIAELPVAGTGKLNLSKLKAYAKENAK